MAGLTVDNPITFSQAIASDRVIPGDVIRIRAGTYSGTVTVSGRSDLPVVFEPYNDEKVVIDALKIDGDYTRWKNIHFAAEWPDGRADEYGKWVDIHGSGTELRHCKIYDIGQVGWWSDASGGEIYGCQFWNTGVGGSEQRFLHPLYCQNNFENKPKRFANNIVMPGFSEYGIHAYAERGGLAGFDFDGVVHVGRLWQIGGYTPISAIQVRNSWVYAGDLRIGYVPTVGDQDADVSGNFIGSFLQMLGIDRFSLRNNLFRPSLAREGSVLSVNWYNAHTEDIDGNCYEPHGGAAFFSVDGTGKTFAQWQALGYDQNGTVIPDTTGIDQVYVRADEYDSDRGIVAIYNWSGRESAPVDLSPLGLTVGREYRLLQAQNPLEEYVSFIYDGSPLVVPMTGWTVAIPKGHNVALWDTTFPTFGAFVVEKA